MSFDIIFVLNWNECYDKRMPVIEVLKCAYKLNKDKTFSGPLWDYDFRRDLKPQNLNDIDFKRVKESLFNKDVVQNRKNTFILNTNKFVEILKVIANRNIFFFSRNKGKLYLIEEFNNIDDPGEIYIKKKSIDKKYKFTIELSENSNKQSLKKGCVFFNFDCCNFVIVQNKLIFLNRTVDSRLLNTIVDNNFRISKNKFISFTNIIDKIDDENVYFNNNNNNEYVVKKNILPQPHLYISYLNEKVVGELKFKYEEIIVDSNKTDDIYKDNIKIIRNKKSEFEYIEFLLSCGWKHSRKIAYLYIENNLSKSLDRLISHSWSVYNEKKRKVGILPTPNINLTSNIDWFDVNMEYIVENETIKLAMLLKDVEKGKKWIQLENGNIYIIPNYLKHGNDIFKYNNNTANNISVKRNNIGHLKYIIDEASEYKSDILEKYLSYKEIKLNIDKNLLSKLRNYQIEGIRWLKYLNKYRFNGCLADDMGLGKTIQTISLLSDKDIKNQDGVTLIIVPKTLIFNWSNEIQKFNSNLEIEIYHGNNRDRILQEVRNIDVIITTYGVIRNDVDKFLKYNLKYVILDEAQIIKNFKSKTYKQISKLKSKNRIILTGTPVENNLNELWGFMNFLNPGLLGTFNEFHKNYLNNKYDSNFMLKLKNKVSFFILRRTKNRVLKELPEKIEQNLYCELTEKQYELYNAIKLKFRKEIVSNDPYIIKCNSKILEGLLYLRQTCCHPKLLNSEININECKESGKFEKLKELLESIIQSKNKVLIFSQFTSMLKIIGSWLQEQDHRYYYLDGSTTNRGKIIEEFEKDNNSYVFLLSLKAGGVGINLTSANYVIIYEPWWNPAVEKQAIDRAYRIGQNKNVIVYRLITLDTVEQKILELNESKSRLSEQILSKQDVVKNFNAEELKTIFYE